MQTDVRCKGLSISTVYHTDVVTIPAFQGLEVCQGFLCTAWMLATVLTSQGLGPHRPVLHLPCNSELAFQLELRS